MDLSEKGIQITIDSSDFESKSIISIYDIYFIISFLNILLFFTLLF